MHQLLLTPVKPLSFFSFVCTVHMFYVIVFIALLIF